MNIGAEGIIERNEIVSTHCHAVADMYSLYSAFVAC